MWKYLLALGLFLVSGMDYAHAANCAAYPYTLTNGQTADANQVMADFNNILSCGNNNLLGKNNNLSDLQSPPTARTNLGLGASAVENLGNTSAGAVTDDGAGNLVAHVPSLNTQVFTGSGTFVVPATATTSTIFRFTVIGGGGGGGGSAGGGRASGGSSGGGTIVSLQGFTPSTSVTISIGAAGTGGSGASNGGAGGTTTVAYAANNVIGCNGGAGGTAGTAGSGGVVSSVPGACSVAVGSSGLILVSTSGAGAQPGGPANNTSFGLSGNGGGNIVGTGGAGVFQSSGNVSGIAGSSGGGGGGGFNAGGGGAGGVGVTLVEYVL